MKMIEGMKEEAKKQVQTARVLLKQSEDSIEAEKTFKALRQLRGIIYQITLAMNTIENALEAEIRDVIKY